MKRTIPIAAAIVLTCLSSRALADGCMMARVVEGRSTQLVASPKQEALMATDGANVQVILRTHFRSGPKELAWIVPVPAKPDKVEAADDALFTTLQERTAP